MPADKVKGETYLYLKTDAPCGDAKLGRLLEGYLNQSLSPADRSAFSAHLVECTSCAVAVYNSESVDEFERDLIKERLAATRPRKRSGAHQPA